MSKERAPWVAPFTATGVLLAVTSALWIGSAPPEKRLETCMYAAIQLVSIVALIALMMLVLGRGHGGRTRRVAAERPGWDVVAAWADGSLAGELETRGVEHPAPRGKVAPLVVAWSSSAIEIWHGGRSPEPLVHLDWAEVDRVESVDGYVGNLAMHAVALRPRAGGALVLCPRGRRGGGLAGASAEEREVLVEHLRERLPAPRRAR
jgi:hypothetical protein